MPPLPIPPLRDPAPAIAALDEPFRLLRPARQAVPVVIDVPHAGPTVVITHHAPSRGSIHPRFDGSPLAVSERLRRTAWQRAVADGVD